MPVVQKFTYSWPPGVTPVTHDQWISQLPAEEQARYNTAVKRQIDSRNQVVENGSMKIEWENDAYVWRDAETAKQNKPSDPEWLEFWERYLRETRTIFKTEYIEVKDE